jgi:hypothetical protein
MVKTKCPILNRGDSVALGSAVVSTAVFGVPPKTLLISNYTPFGVSKIDTELAGGTPAKATETVALPTTRNELNHLCRSHIKSHL